MSRTGLLALSAAWLGRPGAEAPAREALAAAGRSPGDFAREARAHRLAAVALEAAERLGAGDGLLAALRAEARAGTARALALESAAAELAAAAKERGLSAAHLKGPAVDRSYGGRGLRTYDDLDLLVPAGQLDLWRGCLRDLGYAPANPAGGSWLRGPAETVDLHSGALELYGLIDVPEALRPVRLDPEAMLSRAKPDANLAFPALAAEDELLLAACHGFGLHLYARLVWALDVAVLAAAADPARVEAAAAESGAGRMLFHAADAARRLGLLGEPPGGWLERLRPGRLGRLERLVVGRIVRGDAPERAEFLLALAMPAPAGFRRAMLRRALLPSGRRLRQSAAAVRGRGRLGGALRHFGQLARIGALALWG